MKRYFSVLSLILLFITLSACKHVDSLAQAAAQQGVIDYDTANLISLSARAFGSAAENMDPEDEYLIGRAVAGNILSTYRIWDKDPKLVNYLNLICNAIVVHSPQPHSYNGYHVAILDSNEINALTTPGGHIFITRGLINAAQTEDALAGVIAHEIAHYQLKHGIQAIKSSRITNAILFTATAGASIASGMSIEEATELFNEAVGEIVQTMVHSGYSKEQEYEADIAAMSLMAAAGYHPSGLIDMLNELKNTPTTGAGFNKTHPTPGQRIYYAEDAQQRFSVDDTRSMRHSRFKEASE
jgi:predicted Zn-dependent protease